MLPLGDFPERSFLFEQGRGNMSLRNMSLSSLLLEDKVEKLKCSVCLDMFQNPKLLPCSHTYCQLCVQKLVDQYPQRTSFLCPQCKNIIAIPKDGAAGFPSNRYILDDLEELRKIMKEICGPCLESFKRQVRATHICEKCDFKLCISCSATHIFHFQDHVAVQISSDAYDLRFLPGASGNATPLSDQAETCCKLQVAGALAALPCPKHPAEDLRFYCENCGRPICRDCRMTTHFGHDPVLDLADVSAQAVRELRNGRSKVADLIAVEQDKMAQLMEAKMKIEASSEDVKTLINARADDLIAQVEACRSNALLSLESEASVLKAEIDSELDSAENRLQYLQGTESSVCRVIESGSDMDKIELEANMRTFLSDEEADDREIGREFVHNIGLYLIKYDVDVEEMFSKAIGKVVPIKNVN